MGTLYTAKISFKNEVINIFSIKKTERIHGQHTYSKIIVKGSSLDRKEISEGNLEYQKKRDQQK